MRQRQTINQPADIELSGKSLKSFIALNEADAVTYGILKSYMDDNPEVQRDKPTELLTVNNFADYIATINTGYLLGRNVTYSTREEQEENLAKITDWYSEQHMGRLDSQLGLDLATYGRAYEINYADEESKVRTAKLSVFNTFVIYDDSYKHKKQYAISYTPQVDAEGKPVKDSWNITVWSRSEEIKYSLKDETLTEESRTPHFFGRVPVIEYFNNARLRGDFEPVISLIDAYNILQTDRVIDREKLVDAILAISGMTLQEKDVAGIKNNRVMSGIPNGGKVEYIVKELNEANADVLRQVLASDIHKFSMTPDMTDKEFIGNSSGVALKYKLLPFENKAQDKEQYFEDGLRRRLELYIAYMTKRSMFTGKLSANDIDISFHRSLPQNDYETSQMITNLTGLVDRATLAGELSFVHDEAETVKRAAEEETALVEGSFGTTEPAEL